MVSVEAVPYKIWVRYQTTGHYVLCKNLLFYSWYCQSCKVNSGLGQKINWTRIKLLLAKYYLVIRELEIIPLRPLSELSLKLTLCQIWSWITKYSEELDSYLAHQKASSQAESIWVCWYCREAWYTKTNSEIRFRMDEKVYFCFRSSREDVHMSKILKIYSQEQTIFT